MKSEDFLLTVLIFVIGYVVSIGILVANLIDTSGCV